MADVELTLFLTRDEFKWLQTVISHGGETTEWLIETEHLLHTPPEEGGKDWGDVQFCLYQKMDRDRMLHGV